MDKTKQNKKKLYEKDNSCKKNEIQFKFSEIK